MGTSRQLAHATRLAAQAYTHRSPVGLAEATYTAAFLRCFACDNHNPVTALDCDNELLAYACVTLTGRFKLPALNQPRAAVSFEARNSQIPITSRL